jgi:chromosome segregation ATPase
MQHMNELRDADHSSSDALAAERTRADGLQEKYDGEQRHHSATIEQRNRMEKLLATECSLSMNTTNAMLAAQQERDAALESKRVAEERAIHAEDANKNLADYEEAYRLAESRAASLEQQLAESDKGATELLRRAQSAEDDVDRLMVSLDAERLATLERLRGYEALLRESLCELCALGTPRDELTTRIESALSPPAPSAKEGGNGND